MKAKDGKLNMTIHLDRKLWEDFTVKVIREFGGRANTIVVSNLIKQYVDGKIHFAEVKMK